MVVITLARSASSGQRRLVGTSHQLTILRESSGLAQSILDQWFASALSQQHPSRGVRFVASLTGFMLVCAFLACLWDCEASSPYANNATSCQHHAVARSCLPTGSQRPVTSVWLEPPKPRVLSPVSKQPAYLAKSLSASGLLRMLPCLAVVCSTVGRGHVAVLGWRFVGWVCVRALPRLLLLDSLAAILSAW